MEFCSWAGVGQRRSAGSWARGPTMANSQGPSHCGSCLQSCGCNHGSSLPLRPSHSCSRTSPRLHEKCDSQRCVSARSRGAWTSLAKGAGHVGRRVCHRQQGGRCLRLEGSSGARERARQGRARTPHNGECNNMQASPAAHGAGRSRLGLGSEEPILRENPQPACGKTACPCRACHLALRFGTPVPTSYPARHANLAALQCRCILCLDPGATERKGRCMQDNLLVLLDQAQPLPQLRNHCHPRDTMRLQYHPP